METADNNSADGEKQIQEFDVERAVCVCCVCVVCVCVCVCVGGGRRECDMWGTVWGK